MEKKIIWTSHALVQLQEAFLDLLKQTESVKITSRIIDEIYESTSILGSNPEIFKLDSLKKK